MAYTGPTLFAYHPRQSDAALDSKRTGFIDDDDSAVLDPSILDADMMHTLGNSNDNLSTATAFRKDSFANSNGVLSPADSHAAWDPHFAGPLPTETASGEAMNPFHNEPHAFARQNGHHTPNYAHQPQQPSWAFENGSGECTPTTGVEFMPPLPQFEGAHYQRNDSAHPNFTQPSHPHHFHHVPLADSGFAPQVQTPMSPHSHADWMGLAQREMEGRPSHKRVRPQSPQRSLVDLQRRDGIRKKNGRIDIPQERNIATIDGLIENTTDEEQLKELKQQKRLLRNREAALASRQRKKKHTEDLEHKEKGYAQQISSLEAKLSDLTVDWERRERERQIAIHRLEEAQRIIVTMEDEKRDLIMRHNEEASSLRKRVQILSDQLEAGPAPMSTVPSSTGFTDFNAEMEALNMGPHDWDSFILAGELQPEPSEDDFGFGQKPEPAKQSTALEKKPSATIFSQSPPKPTESTSDQPIASLLFMLLLCGAFVASKPVGSQPPDLPKMPADVRAAAPTVLSNLLSDVGNVPRHEHAQAIMRTGQVPMPSSIPSNKSKSSRLDRMHRSITSPTKQQEIDQAFALTPAQYASITNVDFPAYDQSQPPSQTESAQVPRHSLAEALSNLEQQYPRNSKAEVYTRSLLWGQVPADVVREFKDLVREREMEAQQRRPSHDFTYKTEQ